MKRNTPLVIAFCLVFTMTPMQTVQAADEANSDGKGKVLVKAGGGCVGGALLGSIIPIFGTAVGCVLGGVAGWWFFSGDDDSSNMEDTAFVDGTPNSE